MAVISIASCKGGVGRTTITICLADFFARQGFNVAIIDADRKQHVTIWRQLAPVDCSIDVIACVSNDKLQATIAEVALKYSVVFIDHEGIRSEPNNTFAILNSDLILIPVSLSGFEYLGALEIFSKISSMEIEFGRPFPRRTILNRVLFDADDSTNMTRNRLLSQHMLPFNEIVHHRAIYEDIYTTGHTPISDRSDPSACAEFEALAEAIRSMFARGPEERSYKPALF